MAKWAKKLALNDKKIKELEDLAIKLETDGEKQQEKFEKVMHDIEQSFLVPGIIGPDKKNNAYESFPVFI